MIKFTKKYLCKNSSSSNYSNWFSVGGPQHLGDKRNSSFNMVPRLFLGPKVAYIRPVLSWRKGASFIRVKIKFGSSIGENIKLSDIDIRNAKIQTQYIKISKLLQSLMDSVIRINQSCYFYHIFISILYYWCDSYRDLSPI